MLLLLVFPPVVCGVHSLFSGVLSPTRPHAGRESSSRLLIPDCFPGILFTGELWEFLSFTERYPSIISNILLFGLTSALGQVSALGWGCPTGSGTGLDRKSVV